jgi:hypothetical protein
MTGRIFSLVFKRKLLVCPNIGWIFQSPDKNGVVGRGRRHLIGLGDKVDVKNDILEAFQLVDKTGIGRHFVDGSGFLTHFSLLLF